jgi:transcription-repair coupling factor (superfamily II helicase)
MMDLSGLLEPIRLLPGYESLLRGVRDGRTRPMTAPLMRSVRPAIAAALAVDTSLPVVYVVAHSDRLLALADEVPCWAPGLDVRTFPSPNALFYEIAPWGPRTIRQRVGVLAAFSSDNRSSRGESKDPANGPPVILATAQSLMTRTISPQVFRANSMGLIVGQDYRLDQVLSHLVGVGYTYSGLVTEAGQFSRRGGIVDLWPPSDPEPTRLEFFSDTLESVRAFEPSSQRSTGVLQSVLVSPAREGLPRLCNEDWRAFLPTEETSDDPSPRDSLMEFLLPWMDPESGSLLEFVPPRSIVVMDDRPAFAESVSDLEEQAVAFREEQIQRNALPQEFPLPYLTLGELDEALDQRGAIDFSLTDISDPVDDSLGIEFSPGPRLAGQIQPLLDHLLERRLAHEAAVIVSRQAPRIAELCQDLDPGLALAESLPEPPQPGDLHVVHGALTEGWSLRLGPGGALHLLTDAEIFGWGRPRPRRHVPRVAPTPESAFADLKTGDLVVHVDYGIGRFLGLVERTLEGLRREFLLIQYGEGDQLYVPIHQADRLTRYVGPDAGIPSLSRLGTQEWDRVKAKAKEAVAEVARDLLELYAKRMAASGYAFSSDTAWQHELEASFPYVETEDQIRALEAIKDDMERQLPMDRLICGDVGYGKTEVALRAAFKAVMDGKQVALLVPTTVLAQQHFNTFRQRLSPFPVEVEMLSRFRSRSEAEAIVTRLAKGEIDIIIGTHRLLQRDVSFKDLGLVIIDEEQRFGVTHKEYLKQIRTEVDVLTMTATPIPRTLYLALTGARDISTIDTPPEDRLPVVTQVGPYDPRLVRQAILRELNRTGQVFFVHNRVETIQGMSQRLQNLVPEAKIAVAHGQMRERDLAEVMQSFARGEIDVLVSTSIIESGLDIPNANTLIVDRADRFGLSQLYQLRGRVGRGTARGFAYFFRHPTFRTKEDALERLEIIAEHTQLGSGYTIAMHDLEMRGAGDILGTRQHGHIAAIGFHLYTRLLADAVRRIKPEFEQPLAVEATTSGLPELLPINIDLPLSSTIPPEYVTDRDLRLQLYRRMAGIRSDRELDQLLLELGDRFGPPPVELENLAYQLRVKMLAVEADVKSIAMENGQILLQLSRPAEDEDIPDLGDDVRVSKRGVWISRRGETDWPSRLLEVLKDLRRQAPPAGSHGRSRSPSDTSLDIGRAF